LAIEFLRLRSAPTDPRDHISKVKGCKILIWPEQRGPQGELGGAKRGNGIGAAIAGSAVALALLTGCAQPVATGSRTPAPVTGSDSGASPGAPQIGGPAANGNAGLSDPSIVRAGSFPRSFLIPGTDTSIRIGG
jgi:hypothetical protein